MNSLIGYNIICFVICFVIVALTDLDVKGKIVFIVAEPILMELLSLGVWLISN